MRRHTIRCASWRASPRLLACLALATSCWYLILAAHFCAGLPDRSGIAMSISSAFGAIAWTIPWTLGMIASQFGLPWAMALLALGPISLMLGLPRGKRCAMGHTWQAAKRVLTRS